MAENKDTHCPRCGVLFLCNNRTDFGVCDNCWMAEVRRAQRKLAKRYLRVKERK